MAKKPDVAELIQPPERPQSNRQPEPFAGYTGPRTCGHCQHFRGDHATSRGGACHNGISGRLKTNRIDGCAYGFSPDGARYPIGPGPGGVR